MTANQNHASSSHFGVVIRGSRAEDRPALVRLAQLDGRRTLDGERVLVAEVEGEVAAALPLDGGEAIADPFRPTAALVEMLSLRARQLRDGKPPRRRIRSRLAAMLRSPGHRPAMAPATPGNAALLIARDRD